MIKLFYTNPLTMKKIYTLTTMLLLTWLSYGQALLLTEDFSAGTMPPDGWTIEGQETWWAADNTSYAGGTAPEARFGWVPHELIDSTRLISPILDLTGIPNVVLQFKHSFHDFDGSGGFAFGCATRSGGGEWTSIWEENPITNVEPETKVIPLSGTADATAEDFQLCFYFKGDMYVFYEWNIDDIIITMPLSIDAELTSIKGHHYVGTGAENELKGIITNKGLTHINSFDITYTIDGESAAVSSFSGLDIAIEGSYVFTHTTPYMLTEITNQYQLDVILDNVNGETDEYIDNNSITHNITVVPFVPEKKVFGEEVTGTWCGWCPAGTTFMDSMWRTYPDTWIGVAIHGGDPMENQHYSGAVGRIIPDSPGVPAGTVDRTGFCPVDYFEDFYLEQIETFSPATIDVTSVEYNEATGDVVISVSSEFVIDVETELRFAAVIIEDSLWGTSSDWAQVNYYSGGSIVMGGFENLPNPVPAKDIHYNHVAREILEDPFGIEGSLPASIESGSIHTYDFEYNIPPEWRLDKMHFICLLLDFETGEVLNANSQFGINGGVSVNELSFKRTLKVYPNPFSSSTTVAFNLFTDQSVSIRLIDVLGKTVYHQSGKHYPAGFNKISLEANDLQKGIYFIEIIIGNQKYSRKVSVIK